MALKFRKISETSAVKFLFTETLHLLLLKLYLPLVHKIAFANKSQLISLGATANAKDYLRNFNVLEAKVKPTRHSYRVYNHAVHKVYKLT